MYIYSCRTINNETGAANNGNFLALISSQQRDDLSHYICALGKEFKCQPTVAVQTNIITVHNFSDCFRQRLTKLSWLMNVACMFPFLEPRKMTPKLALYFYESLLEC